MQASYVRQLFSNLCTTSARAAKHGRRQETGVKGRVFERRALPSSPCRWPQSPSTIQRDKAFQFPPKLRAVSLADSNWRAANDGGRDSPRKNGKLPRQRPVKKESRKRLLMESTDVSHSPHCKIFVERALGGCPSRFCFSPLVFFARE